MTATLLHFTDAALARVNTLLARKPDATALRFGVKKGGCAGQEYTVDYVTEPLLTDDPVPGLPVYVVRSSVLFLLGTRIDYREDALRSGFVFENPQQTAACGCGESVQLRPASDGTAE